MVGTSPNHRGAGLGRMLYERFFEDMRGRGVRRVGAVTWPGNRSPSRSTGRWGSGRPRARDAEPVRDSRLPRLRRRRRRPGRVQPGDLTAAGVSCSRRRRPKRAGRSDSGTASSQRLEQRLAFGVDEDVGPPQRVLDELEPLGGHRGRVAPDVPQIGEGLVVGAALDVAQEGGVAGARAQDPRGAAMATRSSAASRAAAGSAASGRPARSIQLDEELDAFGGGDHEPFAEVRQALADQALGRVDEQDRGLEATRRGRPDRPPSRRAPGGGPGTPRGRLTGQGRGACRQVRVDVDPRPAPAIEPGVGAPRLPADKQTRTPSPSGRPNVVRGPRRGSASTSQSTIAGSRSAGISNRRPTRRAGRSAARHRGGARRSARRPPRTRRPGGGPARGRSSA